MPTGIYTRTRKHKLNMRKSHLGKFLEEKHPRWKGLNVKYTMIHRWLRQKFGPANKCENIKCSKKSNTFEWCKKKKRKYLRRRLNFIQLCISCHRIYDMSKKTRSKMSTSQQKRWKK